MLRENPEESSAPGASSTGNRRTGTFMYDSGIVRYPVEILRQGIEMGNGDRIIMDRCPEMPRNTQKILIQIQ